MKIFFEFLIGWWTLLAVGSLFRAGMEVGVGRSGKAFPCVIATLVYGALAAWGIALYMELP